MANEFKFTKMIDDACQDWLLHHKNKYKLDCLEWFVKCLNGQRFGDCKIETGICKDKRYWYMFIVKVSEYERNMIREIIYKSKFNY